jgi:hypothetical protein
MKAKSQIQFGMIGPGRMDASVVRRLVEDGHRPVVPWERLRFTHLMRSGRILIGVFGEMGIASVRDRQFEGGVQIGWGGAGSGEL